MFRKLLAPTLLGLCLAALAATQDTQVTVTTQDPDVDTFVVVLPESDHNMARGLLLSMPPSERTMALTLFREVQPPVAAVLIHGLYNVNVAHVMDPDPGASFAEQQAYDVTFERLDENDQAVFRTFWETSMTPAQKSTYLTLVRRAHFGGYPAIEMRTTPPPVQDEPMTPQVETGGMGGQPMLNPMATLAEPVRAAFMRFEPALDPAEKIAYARNLNMISVDQAQAVAEALADLHQMGTTGEIGERQKGINEDDVVRMMASTHDDESRFNSAWAGIPSELQFIFVTAARDAFRGGFADPKTTDN